VSHQKDIIASPSINSSSIDIPGIT